MIMILSKMIPSFLSLCGTIMIHELAHVLIDDHVSQIIDMEISDQ